MGTNAQAALLEQVLAEVAKYGARDHAAHLRRLDEFGDGELEEAAARARDTTDPAVQLHDGQERHRQRLDHRRHGPASLGGGSRGSASFPATATSPGWRRGSATTVCSSWGLGGRRRRRRSSRACEVFVYTENLSDDGGSQARRVSEQKGADWAATVERAVDASTQDDGWAFLGAVGHAVRQLDPAFDPRSYGFQAALADDQSETGPLRCPRRPNQRRTVAGLCADEAVIANRGGAAPAAIASAHLRSSVRRSRASWPSDHNTDRTLLER